MAAGDGETEADRTRTSVDDAAIWRRFRGVAGDDVKIASVQKLNLSANRPDRFRHALPNIAPPDELRAEALMRGVWRIGMARLALEPSQSPWETPLPSKHFADRLHRFSWLPDLVAHGEAGRRQASTLVDSWIEHHGAFNGFSWRLGPTSVRCWNWMLAGQDLFGPAGLPAHPDRFDSLLRQLQYISQTIDTSDEPSERWDGSVALVAAAICVGLPEDPDQALARLDTECTAQILPDGGLVSRSPSRTLSALIDLLTLHQLLTGAGYPVPDFLDKWIPRMGAMVAFFETGDGALCPFNDGDESRIEVVQAALSCLPSPPRRFTFAPKSGFQKLQKGDLNLVLDCGTAPPRPFGDFAHAGALGFELSDGDARLVTSCGYSPEVNVDWQAAVRRTGAHSTLVLGGRDSAVFTLNEDSRLLATSGPEGISAKRLEEDDEIWLDAQHGGYKAPYGLLHRRRLFVSGDGSRLTGEDSLVRPISQPETDDRKFIGFEIRFHLHPTVTAMMGREAIRLICDNGAVWRFKTSHEGARLERTVYLARGVVERPEQIVLAGYADPNGDGLEPPNCIRWAFVRERAA